MNYYAIRKIYMNRLLSRPLCFGDPEQMRVVENVEPREEEEYQLFFGNRHEQPTWKCVKCMAVNKYHASKNSGIWKVYTPHINHCRTCGQRLFLWRSDLWEPLFFSRFLGHYEVVFPLDFISDFDSIPFYKDRDPHKLHYPFQIPIAYEQERN